MHSDHDNDNPPSDAPSESAPARASRPSTSPGPYGGIAVGDVLAGHYVIEGVLDEGGMAMVYLARNSGTGKQCAVKVLHAQLGSQPEIVKLFAKEARVGAVIGDSDHIVEVYDAGIDEAKRVPFIVMELLDGTTLERALEQGPLARDEARIILRQLGEALDQAHAAGVVHRDLKPANLFVTRDAHANPVIKVMDFGIAKVLEEGALRTATQIGTPAYTAPEQMGATTRKLAARQGITIAKGVSPATDVWALGLIAYELLTGQRPGHYWGIETVNELPMKVAFEELESASKRAGDKAELLPDGFDAWFARCMKKNARERWQSAGEAIRALLRLEAGIEDDVIEVIEAPKSRRSLPPALPTGTVQIPDPQVSSTPSRPSRPALAINGDLPVLPRTPSPMLTVPGSPTMFDDELKVDAKTPAEMKDKKADKTEKTAPRAKPTSEGSPRLLAVGFGAVVLAAAGAALYFSPSAGGDTSSQCLTPKAGADAAQVAARCEAACSGGSLQSCAKVAGMAARGDGLAKDDPRARGWLARACGVSAPPAPGDASSTRWIDETQRGGCEQQSCLPKACSDLGSYFQDGRAGAPKQPEIAAALFKRVCQVGYDEDPKKPARGVEGCVGLGVQRERAGEAPAALAFYTAACDGGVIRGCVAKANMLERETDPKTRGQNDKSAYDLYKRACDAGELDGCARLGRMVERGRGGWVRDEPKAVGLYKKACEGGALVGCMALAGEYAAGRGGMTRDAVKAAELVKQACDGGEQSGCALYATMILRGEGGLSRDEARAYSLNEAACEGGALLGCANLGEMMRLGQNGRTRDDDEARRLFTRACDGGEAAGCMHLASLESVKGEPQPAAIEALLQKACEAGAPDGCVKLGSMLEEGLAGFSKDLTRAADLYRRGCDDGSMRGCTNLANLAYNGEGGLEKSAQKSVELNDKACKGGDQVGCARLGVLYALGQGVEKNPARAQELFRGNCQQPSDENKSRCAMLQKLLAQPETPSPAGSAG